MKIATCATQTQREKTDFHCYGEVSGILASLALMTHLNKIPGLQGLDIFERSPANLNHQLQEYPLSHRRLINRSVVPVRRLGDTRDQHLLLAASPPAL